MNVFLRKTKVGTYVCVCWKTHNTLEEAEHHVNNTYIDGFCEEGIRRNLKHTDWDKDEYECVCGKKGDWYEITEGHHDIFKTTCVTEYLRKQDSYCETCDLQCISVYDYRIHCNTLKHKNRKAGEQVLPLECKICNIKCLSQAQIRAHLETKKHKKLVENGTVVEEKLPTRCEVCNVRCPSQAQMKAHLQTKKHLKRVTHISQ